MKYRTIYILFLLTISCTLAGYAQKPGLSGTILDQHSKQPIELATVRLLQTDSTFIEGKNTTASGQFNLSTPKPGKYLLHISYIGYKPLFHPIQIKPGQTQMQTGILAIEQSHIALNEATVVGKLNQIEMVEDTTVFNADAFRVPEGSVLEELIKKLPGVELEDNGTITVNGKQVKQFLINGKDFFKGNTQTALKNLPVELVKKIKSYDKQSDYTEQTGIDDGEEETVMDITLKKELNESWVSNINMGYGSHNLYNGRLFVNRMTDYSRISLYGNLRNPNGTGRSENAGFDFNLGNQKKRKKREAGSFNLDGNMQINRNRSNQRSGSNSETFLTSGAGSSFNNRISQNNSRNMGLSGRMRLEWHCDTLTTITLTPHFSYGESEGSSQSQAATFNQNPYLIPGIDDPLAAIFEDEINDSLKAITVNRNERASLRDGRNRAFATDFMVVRRLSAEGRNINLKGSVNYSENSNRSFNRSTIHYYQPNAKDPFRYTDQYSTNPSRKRDYQLQVGYSEPIFKGGYLQLRYQYAYKYDDSNRSLYQLDSIPGWDIPSAHPLGMLPGADTLQTVLDCRNSQYATYHQYNHDIDLSFRLVRKNIRFNAGVSLKPQTTDMDYRKDDLDTTVTRRLFKIAPSARFQYRFSRTQRLELRYRGSSSDPSMTNLLDITDDSNPLHITQGNPGLKPSWTNRLGIDYNYYVTERQQGWNLNGEYTQTSNTISTATLYDESSGVRTTRPENINGDWNVRGHIGFNTPLDNQKKIRFNTSTNISYHNSVGFIRTSGQPESEKNTNRTLNLGERIRSSYRNDWLEVTLNGQVNYRHSNNKLNPKANLDTYHFSYGTDLQIRLPWKMTLNTDMGMHCRRGYDNPSMNTDEFVWNAQIAQNFLKKNAATLSIRFQDILQHRSNTQHSINAQRRSDSWNEAVYSYCMVHFIYRLNVFKGPQTTDHKRRQSR